MSKQNFKPIDQVVNGNISQTMYSKGAGLNVGAENSLYMQDVYVEEMLSELTKQIDIGSEVNLDELAWDAGNESAQNYGQVHMQQQATVENMQVKAPDEVVAKSPEYVLAEEVAIQNSAVSSSGKLPIILGGLAGAGVLGGLAAGGGGGGGGGSESKPAVAPKETPAVKEPAAPKETLMPEDTKVVENSESGKEEVDSKQTENPKEEVVPSKEAVPVAENAASNAGSLFAANTDAGKLSASGEYRIYNHKVYGKYIDARDFGTDVTGQKDSLAAIKKALAAAHEESAAVYLKGHLKISDQIVLNDANKNVTGLFGDGKCNTTISFDKPQKGVFNPNSNEDDIRDHAGILIDKQNGKTIAELSVKYTNESDFYRPYKTYFGKISGILVNDSDNTLISKVEVSGANRAGVIFTSTDALTREPNSSSNKNYKMRLATGEIDENYETLPYGENNRIVDSYLHHNRVAGALVAYQKNFIAEKNTFSWNGHEKDGGTGYGIASMAGSYGSGIIFRNNLSDHNYRKGFDIHDGNNIVIENNTAIGDRLYGIAVYNRLFSMDNVKINGNTIIQDPDFRLDRDDDLGNRYHGYSAIQLQTNTQFRDMPGKPNGYFEINNNIIKNLSLYKNAIQTYGIEFRNHEPKMDYTLNMKGNHISGDSTKYLIAAINDTKNFVTNTKGPGSGNINIHDNYAEVKTIAKGTMPIYISESETNGSLRGKVSIERNDIKVTEKSDGSIEGICLHGNAVSYEIHDNTFELRGTLKDPIISFRSDNKNALSEVNVTGNKINTDLDSMYIRWLRAFTDADIAADNNSHNGKSLKSMYDKPQKLELDIGGDSVVGGEVNSSASVLPKPGIAQKSAENLLGEKGKQLILSDLLSPSELDLTATLGKDNHESLPVSEMIPVYSHTVETLDDSLQQLGHSGIV